MGQMMAVNQVSLFFYPPRWTQRLRAIDPTALTDAGTPVQVASAVRADGSDGPAVPVAAVAEWLTGEGFTPVPWERAFERGRVRSVFGPEREVIVHVNGDATEVAELYCRFTLPRPHPPLDEWARLVAVLCGRFGLRLAPDGVGPCGEPEFLAAVRGDRNYQQFAASLGWAVAESDPDAPPGRDGV